MLFNGIALRLPTLYNCHIRIKTMANKQTKLNASKSMVQRNRKSIGDKFEKEMDRKLTSAGLYSSKKTVKTSIGDFICDHFVETKKSTYWIESTIFVDTPQARKLNEKKRAIESTTNHIDRWVIFYKEGPGQKSRKNINAYTKTLENEGWTVLNGINEIDLFINILSDDSMSIALNERGYIRKPKLMEIPFEDILPNETNRDIHDKAAEKDLLKLCKCILKYGFLTQLNVVPETINGVRTGKYKLIEGHRRHHAVVELIRKFYGKELEGGTFPCVVVDWVTTEMHKQVHELMILLNTTTKPWNVENYVNSHFKAAEQVNNVEKFFSYGTLKWMYKTADANKFKHSKLLYILGPVSDANTAASKWIDREQIKDGDYRITEKEFDKKMKPFVDNHLIPFIKWHMGSRNYDASNTTVADVFMKSLFFQYRTGMMKDAEVSANVEAFKKIKKKDMPTDANDEGMDTLKTLIKNILDSQNNGVSLNVKTPKKRIAV